MGGIFILVGPPFILSVILFTVVVRLMPRHIDPPELNAGESCYKIKGKYVVVPEWLGWVCLIGTGIVCFFLFEYLTLDLLVIIAIVAPVVGLLALLALTADYS